MMCRFLVGHFRLLMEEREILQVAKEEPKTPSY